VVVIFVILPVALAAIFAGGVWLAWRRAGEPAPRAGRAAALAAAATAVWMALTWQLAASGALHRWDTTPPPFALLLVAIIGLAGRIAFSTTGRRLAQHVPLWALVGVQAFRYPLELAMHGLYEQGVMPGQMSYSGLNFDIVTGVTAVLVSGLVASGRAGRRTVAVWNVLGLLLLINIVTVAVLSTPRVRYFGDDRLNVFVFDPPFVWLPAVMVLAALAGHLVIFRALRLQR
jgi:hypothetical protein